MKLKPAELIGQPRDRARFYIAPSGFGTLYRALLLIVGSLSSRPFETRTATGREHSACQDSDVSQIFILIISNGEKVLSSANVVV